jgi:hypothetical protein
MKTHRLDAGQVYGYLVCFAAVVTFVLGSHGLVSACLNIRELQYTDIYRSGPTLTSLGAYKLDVLRGLDPSVVPPDSAIERMLELERLYRLALSHQKHRTAIVVNAVLAGIAAALFGFHWSWLRRRERMGSPVSSPVRHDALREVSG